MTARSVAGRPARVAGLADRIGHHPVIMMWLTTRARLGSDLGPSGRVDGGRSDPDG